jgi:hypothetical protein
MSDAMAGWRCRALVTTTVTFAVINVKPSFWRGVMGCLIKPLATTRGIVLSASIFLGIGCHCVNHKANINFRSPNLFW